MCPRPQCHFSFVMAACGHVLMPLTLLAVCSSAVSHVFTSSHKLQQLSMLEAQLLASARRSGHLRLRHFAAATASERLRTAEDEEYALRAVNQYRLLRRFSHDWPAWLAQLRREPTGGRGVARFLAEARLLSRRYREVDRLPWHSFLYAGYALNVLQLMYGPVARLEPTLSAGEKLEVAASNLLHNFDDWSAWMSPWWVAKALRRLQLRFPYWSDVARLQFLLQKPPKPHVSPIAVPLLEKVADNLKHHLERCRKYVDESIAEDKEVEACRLVQDTPSPRGRSCFYYAGGLGPYAPFHFEVMHQRPLVAVIHNLVPSSITQDIIHRVQQSMIVSTTVGESGNDEETLTIRLSESGYLQMDSDLNKWLDRRVEAATGLTTDTSSAETPSIINYGIGGYYEGHFDHFNTSLNAVDTSHMGSWANAGDRLATLMVYLSDPSLGGSTVFPNLQVTVRPSVGKGVFWYNLDDRTGVALPDTLHAACPVVNGHKWIVTKWIREFRNLGRNLPKPGRRHHFRRNLELPTCSG